MGGGTTRALALGAAIAAASSFSTTLLAGDAPIRPDAPSTPSPRDRLFFFAGGDVARDSHFAWAGLTGAPQGLLHEDGARIRVMGGVGRYRYRTSAVPGGVNEGHVSSGEILFGFRHALGPAIVTAFLGLHVENQRLAAPDPGHPAEGTAAGIKAAIELYARLTPASFITASASASTVHASYHARGTYGRELSSRLAYGIEAALNGDVRYVEPRVGLFVQIAYQRTTVALSGGYLSNSGKGGGSYASLSIYAPY